MSDSLASTDARRAEGARRLEAVFDDIVHDDNVPVRRRSRTTCASWDSLVQINLVLAIEQEFGVRFDDADAIELNSFDSALEIVVELWPAR